MLNQLDAGDQSFQVFEMFPNGVQWFHHNICQNEHEEEDVHEDYL